MHLRADDDVCTGSEHFLYVAFEHVGIEIQVGIKEPHDVAFAEFVFFPLSNVQSHHLGLWRSRKVCRNGMQGWLSVNIVGDAFFLIEDEEGFSQFVPTCRTPDTMDVSLL